MHLPSEPTALPDSGSAIADNAEFADGHQASRFPCWTRSEAVPIFDHIYARSYNLLLAYTVMVAPTTKIVPEVSPHTQRYPRSSKDSDISIDRSLDLAALTDA